MSHRLQPNLLTARAQVLPAAATRHTFPLCSHFCQICERDVTPYELMEFKATELWLLCT